jgi:hypothetical protein
MTLTPLPTLTHRRQVEDNFINRFLPRQNFSDLARQKLKIRPELSGKKLSESVFKNSVCCL